MALASLFLIPLPLYLLAENGTPLTEFHRISEFADRSKTRTGCVSPDGRIFVSASQKIWVYDGEFWESIDHAAQIPSISDMKPGRDGRVYLCGYANFGYLETDDENRFRITNLALAMDPEWVRHNVFFEIQILGDAVFFLSHHRIVRLAPDGTLTTWDFERNLGQAFIKGGRIYIALDASRLFYLEDEVWHPAAESGPDAVARDSLQIHAVSSNPEEDIVWLATNQGFYRLERSKWVSLTTELDDKLPPAAVQGIQHLGSTDILLETVDGLHVLDREGQLLGSFDRLMNVGSLATNSVFVDSRQTIWFFGKEGVLQIHHSLPVRCFNWRQGLLGTVIGLFSHRGKMHVTTSNQILTLPEDQDAGDHLVPVPSVDFRNGTRSSVVSYQGRMIYRDNASKRLHMTANGRTKVLFETTADPFFRLFTDGRSIALVNNSRIHRFVLDAEDNLVETDEWDLGARRVHDAIFDEQGSLWAKSDQGVILRASPDKALGIYTAAQGFPDAWYTPVWFDGEVVVVSKLGLYRYLPSRDGFAPHPDSSLVPRDVLENYNYACNDEDGNLCVFSSLGNGAVLSRQHGGPAWGRPDLNLLQEVGINEHSLTTPKAFWISGGDLLYRLELRQPRATTPRPVLHLRSVESVERNLWHAIAPNSRPRTIDYEDRILRVRVSLDSLFFSGKNRYRYRVLDQPGTWSDWQESGEILLTGLSEGRYRLAVQGMDVLGQESLPLEWQFSIDPPPYRTLWAYAFYLVAGLGLIFSVTTARSWQLKMQKEKLSRTVRERTSELERIIRLQHESQIALEKAKDEALAASRAKGAFLATMSHELRTPLNGVIGMAQLIRFAHPNQTILGYLDILDSSSSHLLNVINDVLDYIKIQSFELTLEQEPVDLCQVLEKVIDIERHHAESKNLNLSFWLEEAATLRFLGDAQRLEQVLLNLTNNAVKFTERGEVRLHCSANRSPDGTARFLCEVSDTGIGIQDELENIIFEPFEQADASTTRRYGGTGLGLAICRKLARLMNGDISYSSQPGHGTSFRFEFSATCCEPLQHSGYFTHRNKFSGFRIWLGPLHPSTRANLLNISEVLDLQLAGSREEAEAIIAGQGQTAETDLAESGLPCLLLCRMDGLSGPYQGPNLQVLRNPPGCDELLRALQKAFARRPIPSAPEPPPVERPTRTPQPKVLIAEDEEDNQVVLVEMLRQYGYESVVVSNGQEALDAMKESYYPIVFMDLQMPVMNGLEATRGIRQNPGRQPCIIAQTASVMENDHKAAEQAGIDFFLSKPIELKKLEDLLRRLPNLDPSLPPRTNASATPVPSGDGSAGSRL